MKLLSFFLLIVFSLSTQAALQILDVNCPQTVDQSQTPSFSIKVIESTTGKGLDCATVGTVDLKFLYLADPGITPSITTDPVRCVDGSGIIAFENAVGLNNLPTDITVAEYEATFGVSGQPPSTCRFKVIRQDTPVPEFNPLLLALVAVGALFVLRKKK